MFVETREKEARAFLVGKYREGRSDKLDRFVRMGIGEVVKSYSVCWKLGGWG